ncbi:hypothetical protein VNO80_25819 [Phaseolus coccineus]|uniref:Uncharacterized protein n=1 Tax=Phaseolus coccineus TaxID=3886 RepID=A0AAN9M071_PHACN
MACRGSDGRSAHPTPCVAPRPAPQPTRNAPPPAPVQSGGESMPGDIGSTIAQGMAFGTGSAVAYRAVDVVMGPHTIQHEAIVSNVATALAPMANTFGSDACNVHT